ncbi:PREDICTED: multiple epidermal growth factor-like domains protein 11 [Gavialis gangeticus]|uniref:multiple epidermal growth factor-like domains protein 11 n=1 Tax=Gavialis gangeticus TaxID=94835 RepID=UPI00092E31D1|nr:PREDICTED: multiple epidermal growth factor-like domains protein 11 [Gavialis gangeticus]
MALHPVVVGCSNGNFILKEQVGSYDWELLDVAPEAHCEGDTWVIILFFHIYTSVVLPRLYLGLESSCTLCPPGYHCSSAGLTSPSGPCSAGFYCLSGASSPSPAGIRQKGGPCPLSHFCPEGTSFPFPCLAGTYNNLTQQAACFPCAAGYYCPENTTSYSVYPCPPGFYCPTGTKFATEFPCPRGYYNPDPMTQSLDSCLPCPPGHYCRKENLTAVSGKCDAGWFCVSAAWTSQPFDVDNYTNSNCLCPATATGGKCMAGFYCPEGSPEPIPCPPGLYCSASGLSVPSGECAAGFYCTGGAASPKPTDGVTGNICPPGTYCIPGSAMPMLCPAGTFCGLQGQSMVSECQPCLSGFYCAVSGLSAPSGQCWEGYYCDSSQGPISNVTLYPCPQGFYCPPGTQKATQHSCPPGTFGPRQRLKSMDECQGCPPGKYCALPGLAAPTGDCSEGFWCKGGAQVKDPVDGESGLPCPPGRYCLAGTPIPLLCPHGTWSSSKGNKNLQDCQPCSGGHYCNGTGLVAPSGYCSPGFYCISGAQTPTPTDAFSGAPCPVGHYCPLGTESPIPCPPGSYMPQTHGKECYECPEGKYCVPGQEPQSCPKGYYCPRGTGLDWWPCPRGTYSPEQGLESSAGCRLCDGGKFCSHRNATNVAGECWEGFYCTKGSDRPNPHTRFQGQAGPCPPGHYCPRGTAVPEPCPVGTFSTRIKLSSEAHCSPCLPGHYCNSTGLLVPTGQCAEGFYCTLGSTLPAVPAMDKTGGPCPTGYFCPRGTATPLPCPAGSYNPSERQASCLPCTKGFFCLKNSSSLERNECPAGHFCPLGTASATQFPCPRGTYNPQTGSSHISHCIPCDPGRNSALASWEHCVQMTFKYS